MKKNTENHSPQGQAAITQDDDQWREFLESLGDLNHFKKEFFKQRKVFLWGPVYDELAHDVVNRLLLLEHKNPNEEITLYINSPGGIVTAGMVIYDTMKMISSPVKTVCVGLAASMGSIILSGGVHGKREIWPSGRVMIHQPSIGGQLFGQASDLQIHAREITKTKDSSARILSENTGKSIDQVMKDFDRDYWMTAQESLDYGIVDKMSDQTGFSS